MTAPDSPSPNRPSDDPILFDRQGPLGLVLLNRPKALNSLNREMCLAMKRQLDAWAEDDSVCCVVIEGAGEKAFCAGGDIRTLYEAGPDAADEALKFFEDEYKANAAIHHFPKPYIALLDGVTMGGGVGFSVHGSHRVLTEKTLFAMPETGIGMIPDVGSTWFLPRFPGQMGMYLALTGARLKAADCLFVDYGTHFVPGEKTAELKTALAEADYGDGLKSTVNRVLKTFSGDPGRAPLYEHRAEIDRCFAADSVEGILAELENYGSSWAGQTARTIRTMSPIMTKVTFRQLRMGRDISYEDAARLEYLIVQTVLTQPEFYEGVRSVLVERDGTPNWQPASLDAVQDTGVDLYFSAAGKKELVL